MKITWCCPYCGTVYNLPKLIDFDDMNKCCRYWMGKEAFTLYRQKDNASRAEK